MRIPGIAALALFAAACHRAPAPALPALTLPSYQRETIDLSGMRGDVVFVDLWATTCRGCPAFRDAAERLSVRFVPRGVRFLSVNEDSDRQAWVDFMLRHPSPLTEVRDEGHAFQRKMRLSGLPSALVIDRGGVVRWSCRRCAPAAEGKASAQVDSLLR